MDSHSFETLSTERIVRSGNWTHPPTIEIELVNSLCRNVRKYSMSDTLTHKRIYPQTVSWYGIAYKHMRHTTCTIKFLHVNSWSCQFFSLNVCQMKYFFLWVLCDSFVAFIIWMSKLKFSFCTTELICRCFTNLV